MKPKNKTVIIVVGPTAVGKTAVAIQLAKHFNTEIISADSRQCFKELNIGVARPSRQELAEVRHHFIATYSIKENVSAADFEKYALVKLDELFKSHDMVIMTGGTGLYIKAFCEGLDAIPAIDPAFRREIARRYEEKGMDWLRGELEQKDRSFAEKGEMKNPQRMMRALEVMEGTGQSILSFRNKGKISREFDIIQIGLTLPKDELKARIDKRVDNMMTEGLLSEVKSLQAYRDQNALQTVGYSEIFSYFDGNDTVEKAVEQIKIHTRQYAKRQLTWFKKDPGIKWFDPAETAAMINYVKDKTR